MKLSIASLEDLKWINEIYNHEVLTGVATFDTVPKTELEQTSWFLKHQPPYPLIVAKDGSQELGWGCLSPWAERQAYSGSAEITFYVADQYQGKGVGSALFERLEEEAVTYKFHTLLSRICTESKASIRVHEKNGFVQVGFLKEVGFKFNRYLDVVIYQKLYP